jgi:biotin carboxyl carrier protein
VEVRALGTDGTVNDWRASRRYEVRVGGRSFTVSLQPAQNGTVTAIVDGTAVSLSIQQTGECGYSLLIGDRSFDVGVRPDEGGWEVSVLGSSYAVEIADAALAHFRDRGSGIAGGGKEIIRAPMPGLVVSVPVASGQKVEANAPVVVLEAMKMQNELVARGRGIVEEIRVAVGDRVDKGHILAVVNPV